MWVGNVEWEMGRVFVGRILVDIWSNVICHGKDSSTLCNARGHNWITRNIETKLINTLNIQFKSIKLFSSLNWSN